LARYTARMWKPVVAFTLPCLILLGLMVWKIGWGAGPDKLPGRLVDYHEIYDGFWDVACDTAMDGSDRRCYIQYVDVYRPRPDFAAAMVEVVMHPGGDGQPDPHIRFDLEPGLSFQTVVIATETADGSVPLDVSHCAVNTCLISGERARALLQDWTKADALTLSIHEGRPAPSQLSWPMERFAILFADFTAQRAARSLP